MLIYDDITYLRVSYNKTYIITHFQDGTQGMGSICIQH